MTGTGPIIGISACAYEDSPGHHVNTPYTEAIVAAGGFPLLLPECAPAEELDLLFGCIGGILIPGGPDVLPLLYGEEPLPGLGVSRETCDRFEIMLIRKAREAHKPLLAICRGIQVLNVAFGGTLCQDIPTQCPGSLRHAQQPTGKSEYTHTVTVEKGSLLASVYGKETFPVNSFHHQAVKEPAPGFSVSARAADGIIEAVEIAGERILGVQWHPECLIPAHGEHLAPFLWLTGAARG